tara:strand:- start:1827 stop:2135 length:309 start_codon:yes stop_codon:yes gene_type:complete
MEARKLNTKLGVEILFVSVPIVNLMQSKEDVEIQDHQELCEDISNLIEIAEVRGMNRKQIGESLVGCGVASINDHERDARKAADSVHDMVDSWLEFMSNRRE